AAGKGGYGGRAVPFGAGPDEYDLRDRMDRELGEGAEASTAEALGAMLTAVEQGDPDGSETFPPPEPYLPDPPDPEQGRPYMADYFGDGAAPGFVLLGPLLIALIGAAWWALDRFAPFPARRTGGLTARDVPAGADLGDPDAPAPRPRSVRRSPHPQPGPDLVGEVGAVRTVTGGGPEPVRLGVRQHGSVDPDPEHPLGPFLRGEPRAGRA